MSSHHLANFQTNPFANNFISQLFRYIAIEKKKQRKHIVGTFSKFRHLETLVKEEERERQKFKCRKELRIFLSLAEEKESGKDPVEVVMINIRTKFVSHPYDMVGR